MEGIHLAKTTPVISDPSTPKMKEFKRLARGPRMPYATACATHADNVDPERPAAIRGEVASNAVCCQTHDRCSQQVDPRSPPTSGDSSSRPGACVHDAVLPRPGSVLPSVCVVVMAAHVAPRADPSPPLETEVVAAMLVMPFGCMPGVLFAIHGVAAAAMTLRKPKTHNDPPRGMSPIAYAAQAAHVCRLCGPYLRRCCAYRPVSWRA